MLKWFYSLLTIMVCFSAVAQGTIERIPEGLFPLTTEPKTLKVFIGTNVNIENHDTNTFTKWYEEQTGVKVEFQVAAGTPQDITQSLNLMLASGDYPDIILNAGVTNSQLALYGQQGIFLPLNDLIEKAGVETKRLFENNPQAKQVATAPDGNIYALPEVNVCYHCTLAAKMYIYQPWLDKLGLETPTTTEEFRAVLQAFKTQDPNGNGEADEIPLAATTQPPGWNSRLDIFLSSSFITNPDTRRYLNDDVVDVTFNKPEYREALRYINSLYAEGLIAPESLTQDQDGVDRMLRSEEVTVGAVPQGWMSAFADTIGKEGTRFDQYVTLPPLEGPNGHREMPYYGYSVQPGKCIITSAASDPELALRWCDAQGNEEVQLHAYLGEQDVDWRWATPDEVGINGQPAWYVPLTQWGTVQNKHWSQTNLSYRTDAFRLGEMRKSDVDLEVWLYDQSKKIEPYAQPIENVVPPLYFTAEQAQELADIEATITRFVDESMSRFINGDDDINDDAAWDTYIATLEQMGLPRMLEIYQAAYKPN
jgi:putative aldouronate transport system substrate-binding protein